MTTLELQLLASLKLIRDRLRRNEFTIADTVNTIRDAEDLAVAAIKLAETSPMSASEPKKPEPPPRYMESREFNDAEREFVLKGDRLWAIRLYRNRTGAGLIEAYEASEKVRPIGLRPSSRP